MANTYKIIDTRTKSQVGNDYISRKRANTRAEKLNLEYGAHRYHVHVVFKDEQ